MVNRTEILFFILIAIMFLIGGCYTDIFGERIQTGSGSEEPDQSETSVEVQGINGNVELQNPFSNTDFQQLTVIEKLDSSAQLIEIATNMLDAEQFAMAGYWFALAKVALSDVAPEEADPYRSYYQDLVLEINNFYTEYVSGIEVLPQESPHEAIIAGIIEAESDDETAIDTIPVEADTFRVELEKIEPPEVTYDSTAIQTLLDSVVILPPIPLVTNKKVENAISFFQNKGRKVFTIWLERGNLYVPYLKSILREEGMPEDLVYLAMIESGFKPNAYSYAHASGIWQFISSTGRIFGLKVGWWYDERRDPEKATRASMKYLRALYTEFDDWYLALASYNCGEGKVRRHSRKYKTKDFWKLKRLPRQTRNYIPTYIAAATIAKNPTKYGFKEPEYKNFEPVDSVLITECVDLEQIAKFAGTTEKKISKLNPAITRWCTPPDLDEIWVRLPAGSKTDIAEDLKNLPPSERRRWVRHKVRSGEALSTIARSYGTTVRAICDVPENKIHNRHRIRAGKILNIPVPSAQYKQHKSASVPSYTSPPTQDRDKVVYTVRRGDNLSTIARRYGTTVGAIRKWNKLYNKRFIHPGQKLTIWVRPLYASGESELAGSKFQGPIPATHTVSAGETAWDIAQYYDISLKELLRLNNLSRRGRIHPGDKLEIPSRPDQPSSVSIEPNQSADKDFDYYVVRSGDNLTGISKKLNVTVNELKRYNGIRNKNRIKIGQKLKFKSIPGNVEKPKIQDESKSQKTSGRTYIVKKGDTLWDIAHDYNTSIAEIKRLNGIGRGSKIKPGQQLIIPPG